MSIVARLFPFTSQSRSARQMGFEPF